MQNGNLKSTGPRVISYLRFSTPEQAKGDSQRRQTDLAVRWCQENNLSLSSAMSDLGVSAFRGKNSTTGALGAFLSLVEAGKIECGTILLVEELDRISRQRPEDSISLFLSIITKGIIVVTLNTGDRFESGKLDPNKLMFSVLKFCVGHDESEKKSKRLTAVWAEKRRLAQNERKPMSRRCPAWLEVKDDQFHIVPGAKETIRSIFKMKLDGVGRRAITKKLNERAAWTPARSLNRRSGGWRESYVVRILNFRAVLGEYQPGIYPDRKRQDVGDPIPNYYPKIIDEGTFRAVEKLFQQNKGKGGETGKWSNLFAHLVKCAYCGGSLVLIGRGTTSKGGPYLVCDQGRRGVRVGGQPLCKAYAIGYDQVEAAIIDNCVGLRPEQVLPDPGEQAMEVKGLRKRLLGIEGKIADVVKRRASLQDSLELSATAEMRKGFIERIAVLDAEKIELEAERLAAETTLRKLEHGRQSFEAWQRDLVGLRAVLATKTPETRMRMRLHLRELIDKIEVFAVGFKVLGESKHTGIHGTPRRRGQIRDQTPAVLAASADVEDLAEHIFEMVTTADSKKELTGKEFSPKEFHAFLKWVTAKRMSRFGRFIRVHFKSGIRRDLVPGDSIASGRGLEVDENGRIGWRVVRPDFNRLKKQYISYKRHM